MRIFRIEPARAALLFGEGSDCIMEGLAWSSVPMAKQYVLLGSLVAPPIAEFVVNCLVEAEKCLYPGVGDPPWT